MCIYAWKYGHEIKIIDETTTFFVTCLNYEWKRVRGGGNRKSEEFQEAFLFLDLPIVPSVLSFFLSPDPWSSNGNNKVVSSNYWNDQFLKIKKKTRPIYYIFYLQGITFGRRFLNLDIKISCFQIPNFYLKTKHLTYRKKSYEKLITKNQKMFEGRLSISLSSRKY